MKKRYFLVDSENIQNRFFEIMHNARKHDKIIVFYTEYHSGKLDEYMKSTTVDRDNVEFVECIAGENALDLQLMGVLAYLIQKHPRRGYIIYSNDKGYTAAVQHWQRLHIDVELVDFQEPMIISNTRAYEFIPKSKTNPKRRSSSGAHKPFRLKKKEEEEETPARSSRKPRSGGNGRGRQAGKPAPAPEAVPASRTPASPPKPPEAPAPAEHPAQGRTPAPKPPEPDTKRQPSPPAQRTAPTPPAAEPSPQGRRSPMPPRSAPYTPPAEAAAQGHYQPRYSGPQPKPTYFTAPVTEPEPPAARQPKPAPAPAEAPARSSTEQPVSREEKTELMVKPRTEIVPRSAVIVDALFPSKKQPDPARPKPQNTAPAPFSAGKAFTPPEPQKPEAPAGKPEVKPAAPEGGKKPEAPAVKPEQKPAAPEGGKKPEAPAVKPEPKPAAPEGGKKPEAPAVKPEQKPAAPEGGKKPEAPAVKPEQKPAAPEVGKKPEAPAAKPEPKPAAPESGKKPEAPAVKPEPKPAAPESGKKTRRKPKEAPASAEAKPEAKKNAPGLSEEEVIAALCRSFPAGDLVMVNRMLSICFGTVGAKEFYARFKADEAYRGQMAALYLPDKDKRLSSLVETALKWNGHSLEQAEIICRIIREGDPDNTQEIYHRFVKEIPVKVTERQALYRAIKPYLAVMGNL